jgi:hypothetical protein
MNIKISELTDSEIDKTIDLLTHDLKRDLNHMFNIPREYSSMMCERFVDNMITVAVLTIKKELKIEQAE